MVYIPIPPAYTPLFSSMTAFITLHLLMEPLFLFHSSHHLRCTSHLYGTCYHLRNGALGKHVNLLKTRPGLGGSPFTRLLLYISLHSCTTLRASFFGMFSRIFNIFSTTSGGQSGWFCKSVVYANVNASKLSADARTLRSISG